MHGVIDRIEDGIAIILIASKEIEWSVNEADLPQGSREGTVLQLAATADGFSIIGVDKEATIAATDKATSLQKKLQAKKKRSKFKR